MLDELLNLVDQMGPPFQAFLLNYIPSDALRGALIEVDDYWANAAKSDLSKRNSGLDSRQLRVYHGFRLDKKFRPADWSLYCKTVGYDPLHEPFILRVIVTRTDTLKPDLPREFTWGDQRFPIRYEVRGECRALVDFGTLRQFARRLVGVSDLLGVSVGRPHPRSAGTLGGMLRQVHNSGTCIVSCAHVLGEELGTEVQAPGPHEGKHSEPIGQVVYSQLPELKHPRVPCNIYMVPHAVRLDCAIAELNSNGLKWIDSLAVRKIQNFRHSEQMDSWDPVYFIGKESGRVDAVVSGVTIWDVIRFPNNEFRCFSHIFSMRYPEYSYVSKRLAQEGDSGAWVFSELDELTYWDGMLIAGDERAAYGCFAETIMNAATPLLGPVELMSGLRQ